MTAHDQGTQRVRERPGAPERRAGGGDDPVATLSDLIQKKGLKHSRQRESIAQVFFDMGGHVPIEALVSKVRERDPHISVATVYRTMKLLSECGLAVPRRFGDGQTRYEPATRQHPDAHDHLICTGCGAIVEFESDRISELQARVARRHGFAVERRRLELYGRCGSCRVAGPDGQEPAP